MAFGWLGAAGAEDRDAEDHDAQEPQEPTFAFERNLVFERNMLQSRRIRIQNETYSVTITNAEEAITMDDMIMQLNQVMMNVTNRVLQFECHQRVLDLYVVVMKLNEISAHTGLSTTQLCDVINICT